MPHPGQPRRRAAIASTALAAVAAVGVLSAAGCTVTAGGFANENDRLRDENQQLTDQLAEMTRDRNEWRAKAGELESAGSPLTEEALAALPRITGLDIDPLTGLVDRDDEPGYEAVDVYVLPKDARNRFVQAVGTITVSLLRLPAPGSEAAPELVVSRTLTPADLREAYRNTLLSVHYTVPMPLDPVLRSPDTDAPGAEAPAPVTYQVVATLIDALTGEVHTETKLIEP